MRGLVNLLPLFAMAGLFWFLLVRPARARQQQALRLRDSVTVGQRVLTTSGLHATVVALDGDTVDLQTSPGVVSRWDVGAVGRIVETGATGGTGSGDAGVDLEKPPGR